MKDNSLHQITNQLLIERENKIKKSRLNAVEDQSLVSKKDIPNASVEINKEEKLNFEKTNNPTRLNKSIVKNKNTKVVKGKVNYF